MSVFGPIKKVKIIKNINKIISGESFDKLNNKLDHLTINEKIELKKSSIEILKKCIPSFSNLSNNQNIKPFNNTGLIIGKIQSGKTLSFTSVMSLARDNGYRIVIVISGRTTLLLKQTVDRLKIDLSKNDKYIKVLTNCETPEKKLKTTAQLKRVLRDSNGKPSKMCIIPILKHQKINNLKKIFLSSEIQKLLKTKSILIIDDEADQASLNTKARYNEKFGLDDESAIFASIKNLRYALPLHTYLQYTATPQAPLLIDTTTLLSPDWHVLLSPGEKYSGGNDFFNKDKNIVSIIPQEGDYPPIVNPQKKPKSLSNSLIEFLITSALMSGEIEDTKTINERATMLIHPTWRVIGDNKIVGIETFYDWVINILETLEKSLEQGDYSNFSNEYEKIKNRLEVNYWSGDFPSLDAIADVILDDIIADLETHQVTGGKLKKGEEFPWDNCRYHILVGGQLLDRGFTVENLIMTYMPRDTKGNNQADTIEQRCRFYGYRKSYLNFCRVYITPSLREDYINYNRHENELHKYLLDHTLSDFLNEGCKMMMAKNLLPTNMSRISQTIISNHLKGFQYFNPQGALLKENNDFIDEFVKKVNFKFSSEELKPKIKNDQKENVCHKLTKVPIITIIELLQKFVFNNKHEIMKNATILRYIDYLKDDFKFCWVIEIAINKSQQRERTINFVYRPKSAKNQYQIPQLAAGDTIFKDGRVYFADRKLLIETDKKNQTSKTFDYQGELIMQVHNIKVKNVSNDPDDDSEIKKGDIFKTLAFNFSDVLSTKYISTQA